MPKGLLVEAGATDYAFVSRSTLYNDAAFATATGISNVDIPSGSAPCPYRVEELLKAGVMFSATVYLNEGNGKRSGRRIYISSAKKTTYKLASSAQGLIGLSVGSKAIISVSKSRKASFSI